MSTTASAPPEPGLRAELRAVEAANTRHHWHCWLSDSGCIWATSPHCEDAGSGTTVSGGSPQAIAREIAEVEHLWELAA